MNFISNDLLSLTQNDYMCLTFDVKASTHNLEKQCGLHLDYKFLQEFDHTEEAEVEISLELQELPGSDRIPYPKDMYQYRSMNANK